MPTKATTGNGTQRDGQSGPALALVAASEQAAAERRAIQRYDLVRAVSRIV